MGLETLRKDLKTGEVIFGADRTMKELKNGNIRKIYLSNNCPDSTKSDVIHYSKLGNVEVEELKESNEELATICKKTFNISVISIKK